MYNSSNSEYQCVARKRAVFFIIPHRMYSYRHTTLSEISNRIMGISCTIFLPMWGLQIVLFSLQDSLV